jgi:hypothetical protein
MRERPVILDPSDNALKDDVLLEEAQPKAWSEARRDDPRDRQSYRQILVTAGLLGPPLQSLHLNAR